MLEKDKTNFTDIFNIIKNSATVWFLPVAGAAITVSMYLIYGPSFFFKSLQKTQNTELVINVNNTQEKIEITKENVLNNSNIDYRNYTKEEKKNVVDIIISASFQDNIERIANNFLKDKKNQDKFKKVAGPHSKNKEMLTKILYDDIFSPLGLKYIAKKIINHNIKYKRDKYRNKKKSLVPIFDTMDDRKKSDFPYLLEDDFGNVTIVKNVSDDFSFSTKPITTGNDNKQPTKAKNKTDKQQPILYFMLNK